LENGVGRYVRADAIAAREVQDLFFDYFGRLSSRHVALDYLFNDFLVIVQSLSLHLGDLFAHLRAVVGEINGRASDYFGI
jgi:hypothetical protein